MDDQGSGIVGQMVLDQNGNIKSSSGSMQGQAIGQIIDRLMQDAGHLLSKDEVFNRMTVSFGEFEFYLYYDKIQQLCVVQKKKF